MMFEPSSPVHTFFLRVGEIRYNKNGDRWAPGLKNSGALSYKNLEAPGYMNIAGALGYNKIVHIN